VVLEHAEQLQSADLVVVEVQAHVKRIQQIQATLVNLVRMALAAVVAADQSLLVELQLKRMEEMVDLE
jgi:hypothetical protein